MVLVAPGRWLGLRTARENLKRPIVLVCVAERAPQREVRHRGLVERHHQLLVLVSVPAELNGRMRWFDHVVFIEEASVRDPSRATRMTQQCAEGIRSKGSELPKKRLYNQLASGAASPSHVAAGSSRHGVRNNARAQSLILCRVDSRAVVVRKGLGRPQVDDAVRRIKIYPLRQCGTLFLQGSKLFCGEAWVDHAVTVSEELLAGVSSQVPDRLVDTHDCRNQLRASFWCHQQMRHLQRPAQQPAHDCLWSGRGP